MSQTKEACIREADPLCRIITDSPLFAGCRNHLDFGEQFVSTEEIIQKVGFNPKTESNRCIFVLSTSAMIHTESAMGFAKFQALRTT